MNASFRQAIMDAGMTPPDHIRAGCWERFPGLEKKTSNRAGFCFLFGDLRGGVFGDFSTEFKEFWHLGEEMSLAEQATARKQIKEAQKRYKKERNQAHKKAAKIANDRWDKAVSIISHPYLEKKKVLPLGIRREGKNLIIPIYVNDVIVSIQTITPEGEKRFQKHGQIAAGYYSIGKPKKTLYICEGYATGVTLHQATDKAVAVAFNSGNLKPVAETLHSKYPDLEIVIVADNDQYNVNNPGVTKAKEAAIAVNGRVIIPEFVNTESNPTDFNDLATLEGLEQVRKFINEAQAIEEKKEDSTVNLSNNDEQVIKELAQLSTFQYDRLRITKADELGVQVSTLDREVKKARNDFQTDGFNLGDPEPFQSPVNGADLLDEIVTTLKRYLVLPEHAAEAIALWILFTYVIDSVRICTMLAITSPEKRCGKTSTLAVLLKLCSKALPASNISPAALFRTTEKLKPTLLIDEADTFLRNSEEMRGILNSGHTREMAFTIRTVGDNHESKHFSTWGAKVIAAIGKLKDTIMDRCIEICMRRKKPGEKVERLKNFDGLEIKSRCVRWANDNAENIKNHEPEIPISLHDRAADNWEPLLSIAELAGGKWPEIAKKAACALTQNDVEEDSIKIQLLADIKSILKPETEKVIDRIWTESLLNQLYDMEERPWADWKKGKALSARNLSRLLKTFGIQSKDLKMEGVNKKGYRLEDFNECFPRYLPATPLLDSVDAPFSDYQCATQNKQVADENPLKPSPDKEGSGVADENRGMGGNEDIPRKKVSI